MDDDWVLVTGANGFIGARLVRHLVEMGERVKAFVRPSANLDQLRDLPHDRVRMAYGEVSCSHTVYRALAACDRVYHLADNFALSSGKVEEMVRPSVLAMQAVLEAARRRQLRKIVVTSSVGALGVSRDATPLTEKSTWAVTDAEPYYAAKYHSEQVALEAGKHGLPVVVVNPAVVVGPGDWKPTPSGRMLLRYLDWPSFAKFRYPATGGISIADVDDVARGHRLAMIKGRVGERYILGGENVSTRDLFCSLIPEITGFAPPVAELSPGAASWVARGAECWARLKGVQPEITVKLVEQQLFQYSFATSEKAERELGYSYRPAREALVRAIRWFRRHGYVSPQAAQRVARAA